MTGPNDSPVLTFRKKTRPPHTERNAHGSTHVISPLEKRQCRKRCESLAPAATKMTLITFIHHIHPLVQQRPGGEDWDATDPLFRSFPSRVSILAPRDVGLGWYTGQYNLINRALWSDLILDSSSLGWPCFRSPEMRKWRCRLRFLSAPFQRPERSKSRHAG